MLEASEIFPIPLAPARQDFYYHYFFTISSCVGGGRAYARIIQTWMGIRYVELQVQTMNLFSNLELSFDPSPQPPARGLTAAGQKA